MANIALVNRSNPTVTGDEYIAWDLMTQLLNAGWVCNGSSDGTTKIIGGTGWAAYTTSGAANSWMAISRPGNAGHGILLYRSTAGGGANRNVRYTISGWNMSGSTGSTPPVANATTYVTRLNSLSWFSLHTPVQTLTYYNIIARDGLDDHSITLYGFNGSILTCMFGYTFTDAATTHGNIGDPYAFVAGPPSNGWGAVTYLGSDTTWIVNSDNSYQECKIAYTYMLAGGNFIGNLGYRDSFVNATARYLPPIFVHAKSGASNPTYKGVARWMRIGGTDHTSLDFYDSYKWVCATGSGGVKFILPWDGATTTISV